MNVLIFPMQKMWGKLVGESKHPTSSLMAESMEATIVFKKFFAECSKANINAQPLIKLLSIIYGHALVEKGLLALMAERISSTPLLMDREMMKHLMLEIRESNRLQEWTSAECLSFAETTSTALASPSTTSGG